MKTYSIRVSELSDGKLLVEETTSIGDCRVVLDDYEAAKHASHTISTVFGVGTGARKVEYRELKASGGLKATPTAEAV